MACNTVGTWNYLATIDWKGTQNFMNSKKKILKDLDGSVIGNYKHYQALTFAIIYNAGHMVPQDQPSAARRMLEMFIENKFNSGDVTQVVV